MADILTRSMVAVPELQLWGSQILVLKSSHSEIQLVWG